VVSDAYPVLETRAISPIQDVVDASSIVIGQSALGLGVGRGRVGIGIPDAEYGAGTIGIKFERLDTTGNYQKTYQSYIIDRENSGKLYMMVVGSESDGTSKSRFFDHINGTDTVDIFEMPGRPIVINRGNA
jgi:hypothetical protein